MKKIQKVAIYIQIDAIKWKILILEKHKKKNHQIWISYDREILFTNFNSELKEKDKLHMCSSRMCPHK